MEHQTCPPPTPDTGGCGRDWHAFCLSNFKEMYSFFRCQYAKGHLAKYWLSVIVIAILAAISLKAKANTAVFQQGAPNPVGAGLYEGVEDTSLIWESWWTPEEGYGGTGSVANFGFSETLRAGDYNVEMEHFVGCGTATGLIRFDLSGLAGQTIQTARLYLWLEVSSDEAEAPSLLDTIGVGMKPTPDGDSDWVAGTSDGQPQVGASCFEQKRYLQANWQQPYSFQCPQYIYDWAPSEYTGRQCALDPYEDWFRCCEVYIDLPSSLVSRWATSPENNGGLVLFGWKGYVLSGGGFCTPSSESPYQGLRPALAVTYVPEPSSFAALAIALCVTAALIKRR